MVFAADHPLHRFTTPEVPEETNLRQEVGLQRCVPPDRACCLCCHPIHCDVCRPRIYCAPTHLWRVSQPPNLVHVLGDCNRPRNELLLCNDWDPSLIHNPNQSETPIPRRRHDPPRLAQVLGTAVNIPLSSMARVDGFKDDLKCVFLDSEENRSWPPHAVPLVMQVINCPHGGDGVEPIKRRKILSTPKLQAEGTPDERQIVLG
jgi:hypothetical protein